MTASLPISGLVKGVAITGNGNTLTEETGLLCGSRCASCNAATGQCTQCIEGAVLVMDASSPNQVSETESFSACAFLKLFHQGNAPIHAEWQNSMRARYRAAQLKEQCARRLKKAPL